MKIIKQKQFNLQTRDRMTINGFFRDFAAIDFILNDNFNIIEGSDVFVLPCNKINRTTAGR